MAMLSRNLLCEGGKGIFGIVDLNRKMKNLHAECSWNQISLVYRLLLEGFEKVNTVWFHEFEKLSISVK